MAPSWAHGAAPAPDAPAVDARGPVLGPLLARNRDNHPGAARGANHASMALLALAALGGAPAELSSFGERMLRKGKPFPPGGGSIERQRWRERLGDMDALPAFRRFFDEEVARRGVAATLRSYLPELSRAPASAEYHCMIRTAYGVRFGDPAEVAMGLAYWSAAFMPLGSLLPAERERDPIACLADARAKLRLAEVGNIDGGKAGALKWVSTLPDFPAAASTLRIEEGSLAVVARTMVRLYAVPGRDLLHTVTGTHAYRTLEPFLADRRTGRRHLWQTLVAYYLSAGAPDLVDPPPLRLPGWPEILAAARSSPDDHGCKITHTALEEYRLYRDPRYLEVAARRWGLV
jgi:hypothetical protein